MQQAHVKHPSRRRDKVSGASPSGWPNGYFGTTPEASGAVCPNCYRSVNGSLGRDGLHCPRCGTALPLADC